MITEGITEQHIQEKKTKKNERKKGEEVEALVHYLSD